MARKRVYEVVNNVPGKKVLKVGDKEYKYGRHGVFTVRDESLGKEIKEKYDGFDAVVNEVEMSTNTEPGHRYTFGAMTSHAADEFWDRYEKKKRELEKRERRKRSKRAAKKTAEVNDDDS